MKKNILKVTLVAAFALFAGYNVYNAQKTVIMSDLVLANLEAVADPTEGGGQCKWKVTDCSGWGNGDYEACLTNGDGNSCSCGSVSRNCPD